MTVKTLSLRVTYISHRGYVAKLHLGQDRFYNVFFFFALSGGGYQRLRAHLYGSLLYYLQIAQKPEEPDTLQTGTTQKH